MTHAPRILLVLAAVTLVVMAWPSALGGATSYVVVSGVSMEPTYETGDLVVARSSDDYEVGDVIAFRTEEGDVIHRIIGGNAEEGFRTQGDNVDRPDPYLPRPADIRGKALFHVPAIGAWGLRLVRTVPAPVLAAGAILLAVGGTEQRRRRRRRPRRDASPTQTPTPEPAPRSSEEPMSTSLMNRPRVRGAAMCVVAAVVVLPSAFLAWRAPTTVEVPVEEAAQRHVVSMSVTGITGRSSDLYPDGRSEPITAAEGDPSGTPVEDAPALLRSLVERVEVTVDHEVAGQEAVTGAGRIDVVIRTGRGFELPLPGVPMTTFTGTFEGVVDVDLDVVDQRFEEYLTEADLSRDTMTIEVRPVVATDDDVVVRGGPLVLTPTEEVVEVGGTLRTTVTPDGAATVRTATAPLVGIPLPVPVVRGLGTALVIALLGLALWLLRREVQERPDLRIGLVHGSLLVEIEPDANVGGDVVRVSSFAELARLAKRDHRPVLHQERSGGNHHYLVPDGDLTYEYVVDLDGSRAPGPGLALPDDVRSLAAEHPGTAPDSDTSAERGQVRSGPSERGEETSDRAPIADDAPRTADTADQQSPTSGGDDLLDYLPVTPADLPSGRVVVVEDFTELTRIWMQDNAAPGRLERRRLGNGGIRYSVVRNGREFVYEAGPDEDVAAGAGRHGGTHA